MPWDRVPIIVFFCYHERLRTTDEPQPIGRKTVSVAPRAAGPARSRPSRGDWHPILGAPELGEGDIMKRGVVTLGLAGMLLIGGAAKAQTILSPLTPIVTGHVSYERRWVDEGTGGTSFSSYASTPDITVARDFWSWSTCTGGGASCGTFLYQTYKQGVIEFLFPATIFTRSSMTTNNFTAKLNDLDVDQSSGTGSMQVNLRDMADSAEDAQVDENDFKSFRGGSIASITHHFGGAHADFTNVDVTDAVRHDLFRDGLGQTTIGFLLFAPGQDSQQVLKYSKNPEIVITVYDTDAGGDGDTDTDGDADVDGDASVDTHDDSGAGMPIEEGEHDDNGCNTVVGRPTASIWNVF